MNRPENHAAVFFGAGVVLIPQRFDRGLQHEQNQLRIACQLVSINFDQLRGTEDRFREYSYVWADNPEPGVK